MKHTITLEKPLDAESRQFRIILVDGNPWGYVEQVHRGMHGTQYHFVDSGGCIVPGKHDVAVSYDYNNNPRRHACVWSDKHYLSSMGYHGHTQYATAKAKHEGKYQPLEDRLIDAIRLAIQGKRLLSPAEIVRRDTKEREEYAAQIARDREERLALYRAHAEHIIVEAMRAPGGTITTNATGQAALRDAIAAAMLAAREGILE